MGGASDQETPSKRQLRVRLGSALEGQSAAAAHRRMGLEDEGPRSEPALTDHMITHDRTDQMVISERLRIIG